MQVTRIDHIVLTVTNLDETVAFYETVLGCQPQRFDNGRTALCFGRQKINLHEYGREQELRACSPVPGSGDLCFVTDMNVADAMKHVSEQGVPIICGPVERTGALGPMQSFYFRDPDKNLIEVASYVNKKRIL